MQGNSRQLASCTGKERFGTRSLAERVQKRRCRQRDKDYDRGGVYFCAYCQGFHIGTHDNEEASLWRYRKKRAEMREPQVPR